MKQDWTSHAPSHQTRLGMCTFLLPPLSLTQVFSNFIHLAYVDINLELNSIFFLSFTWVSHSRSWILVQLHWRVRCDEIQYASRSAKLPSGEWSLLLWFLTPLAELTPKQSLSASFCSYQDFPILLCFNLCFGNFERRIGKKWGFGIKQSWIQNLVFITFLLCFLSGEGKIILTVGARSLGSDLQD